MARRLKVVVVHNRYQLQGGEDSVVDAEIALLREAGHDVIPYIVGNDHITGAVQKLSTAALTTYNPFSRMRFAHTLKLNGPDIVHVHNFFPTLSPSIFDACAEAGVPAIWTLHNYRIGCANALLFRDGRPCEDCLHGSPYQAVLHRCYRGSRLGSLTLATSIAAHRRLGTWRSRVSRFIALTEFAKSRFVKAGVPDSLIRIKPNFVHDPRPSLAGQAFAMTGPNAVYIGRLSVEKGVRTLMAAWRDVAMPLRVVGDGPLADELRASAPPNVTFVGLQPREAVYRELQAAALMVLPSICYENFPVTAAEAMAMGKPVVASAIGALQEVITDGEQGLLFRPGDPVALARAVNTLAADPRKLDEMGSTARARYETSLTPAHNLRMLTQIYEEVLAERSGSATIRSTV